MTATNSRPAAPQPRSPAALLTHVLRTAAGQYWRVRGYGSTVSSLDRATLLSESDAERLSRQILWRHGRLSAVALSAAA